MTKPQQKKIKSHSTKEILSKSMSCSIWKDLPPELLEIVLVCLPTHVLCRFRLVCKEWNQLISQPNFAKLCALSPRKASSIFIFPKLKHGKIKTLLTEWQVQDPTEKRSYKFSDSFIMDSYLSSNMNKGLRITCLDWAWFKYTLASAGELIYTMYLSSDWPTMPRMHIICNPMSKSFYEIPELPRIQKFINNDIVVMLVDNATQTYKIVTVEMYRDKTIPGSQNLFLYESMTSTWRKLCEVPDVGLSTNSSIFMKGIFYTLFEVSSSVIPFLHEFYTIVLYSCDLVTGAWSKMDVNFPPLLFAKEHPQLVVSSGQLYMVKFTKCKKEMVRSSIWKIVLETKEVVKVVEIQNLFKLSQPIFYMTKVCEMPVAVGCANSIIISCKKMRRVKFDLFKKRWQELSSHTLNKDNGSLNCGISACLVDF